MSRFFYGGQAVIEGVMMRGRAQATVVMRSPDGTLVTHNEALPGFVYRHAVARLPFVRGLVLLWEMMILGTRLMLMSADVQARGSLGRDIPRRLVGTMMAVSLALAVGVFFVLPLILGRTGAGIAGNGALSAPIEGLARLAIFVGYLIVIGRLGRMRRVFEYHGAEHKAINAYEAGDRLEPSTVQRHSLVHVRCGTAFMLWVLLVSIVVFAFLGHPPLLEGVALRIALVPVIAAVSYEILRVGATFYHVAPVRIVMQPGLWLQGLTTRQPSDVQVAVAIAALLPVLEADGVETGRLVPALS